VRLSGASLWKQRATHCCICISPARVATGAIAQIVNTVALHANVLMVAGAHEPLSPPSARAQPGVPSCPAGVGRGKFTKISSLSTRPFERPSKKVQQTTRR
jgi:hypothetical protein